MRIRFGTVSESTLWHSVGHQVFAVTRDWFNTWQAEDYIALVVGDEIAAIGYASGDARTTTSVLQGAGLGPHSMPVIWTHLFAAGQRPPVTGALWEILEEVWGETAEWAFTNLGLLEGAQAEAARSVIGEYATTETAEAAASAVEESEPDVTDEQPRPTFLHTTGPPKQAAAPASAPVSVPRRGAIEAPAPAQPVDEPAPRPPEATPSQPEATPSTDDLTDILIALGRTTGCDVWARRDGTRPPPAMPVAEFADLIWMQDAKPVASFTLLESEPLAMGLLDVADRVLATSTTTDDAIARHYVTCPSRTATALAEALRRPVFAALELTDLASFIDADQLRALLARVHGLEGHVAPSVIETVGQSRAA